MQRTDMDITRRDVRRAMDDDVDPWALGNRVLYDLCWKHPLHRSDQIIIAKVWLIGRSYAAAVERRRQTAEAEVANDPFYEEHVAPAFRKSEIDHMILRLRRRRTMDAGTLHETFTVHKYLTDLLYSLTGLNKRSFASKYLHFHLPSLFFIYDSRAVKALKRFRPRSFPRMPAEEKADRAYARFATAALGLRDDIRARFGVSLTPRQLDRLLLRGTE